MHLCITRLGLAYCTYVSWVATRAALARSVIGTCKALGAVAMVGVDVRVVVGCIIVLM